MENWIITAMKLEWIESDRIEFKIGLDLLLLNQSNYQSFARSFINQSQTMDLSI